MMLLQMRHLVNESRETGLGAALPEMRRIQRDLVGDFPAILRSEPVTGKIAVGALAPLHGDEARRQPAAEQLLVEKRESVVERRVGLPGRIGCRHGSCPDFLFRTI